MSLSLRVATLNIFEGGLDDGDQTRLEHQIDLINDQRPDLLALQKATWGPRRYELLHRLANRLDMSFRTIVRSNHHGCDIAVLVRESEQVKVVGEAHDTSGAWWHALAVSELHVQGVGRVDFLATHLAPSSPTGRLREAEALGLFKNRPSILVGDLNALPATDPEPDLGGGVDPGHAHGKLDRRAAQFIQTVGFTDVGAHVQDLTPTVGFRRSDRLAFRCDRILFNRLPVTAVDYRVVPAIHSARTPGDDEAGYLSDHHMVAADLHLQPRTGDEEACPR